MKNLLGIIVAAFLLQGLIFAQDKPAPVASSGVRVEKIVVATSVDNREPVGENTEFQASAGTLSCWTKIIAASTPTTIKHVWYADGNKVFEQPLEIKMPSTRTWSTKSVHPGSWKVDVTDESGAVLSTVSFAVK